MNVYTYVYIYTHTCIYIAVCIHSYFSLAASYLSTDRYIRLD